MAGSGVGKSTLLGMVVRGTTAPVRVVALVGERGREVREFLEDTLDPDSRARTVVVVATGDDPPLLRLTAAFTATRIAEWFRDQGGDVLLVRGLGDPDRPGPAGGGPGRGRAAGDPRLPGERLRHAAPAAGAGRARSRGKHHRASTPSSSRATTCRTRSATRSAASSTATSSSTGALATAGHFPSIDVLESVSRVDRAILPPERLALTVTPRRLLAARRDVRELVEVGAYARGSDPVVDLGLGPGATARRLPAPAAG